VGGVGGSQTLKVLKFIGVEWEDELRSLDRKRSRSKDEKGIVEMSRFLLVAEYLADLEILAAADVFIGSYSNVYAIVAAKRLSGRVSKLHLHHYLFLKIIINVHFWCFI